MPELTQLIAGPYHGTESGSTDRHQVILLPALGFGPELWTDCAHILAQHYHVTAVQFPTLEQLDPDTCDLPPLERYTRWLIGLLHHERYRNATLVGIDFSAQLALRALHDASQLIERVIAIAPTGLRHPIAPLVKLLRLPVVGRLALAGAASAKLKRLITAHVYNEQRLSSRFLADFFAALNKHHRQQATLDIIRTIPLHEDDELILNLPDTCTDKVTLVWGESDRQLSLQYGFRFAQGINRPLNKINYAGHLPPVEQPRWTASLIDHAVDDSKPVHIDLKGYNGIACADYIVRSEIAARTLKQGAELIIHTLYQCAGDDVRSWSRLTDKFKLIDVNHSGEEWSIHIRKI